MEIIKTYVIYKIKNLLGSKENQILQKFDFENAISNNFDSEEKAIQALIDSKQTFTDFYILKEIFIRN